MKLRSTRGFHWDQNRSSVLSAVEHLCLTSLYSRLLRITLNPHLTVRINFLFPDRHRSFKLSDQPLARLERRPSMRSGDRDHNARFSDLQTSQAVNDSHVRDLEIALGLLDELPHFLNGHW